MLAELQLSTDMPVYILSNRLQCFNPFEKHHGNMLQNHKKVCLYPCEFIPKRE